MARPPRLAIPGVALHVIQRGNNREACFRDDRDYLVYLDRLSKSVAEAHCALHAYCLMTNHVHLLLTPESPSSCGDLMRDLGRVYVRYFNDRYGRTGTLWEGRFRSCLVDSALYVLACYRYIELNPVRAGMVKGPADYPWSSFAANAGKHEDPRIFPHAEYLALSADSGRRQEIYREFVNEADAPSFLRQVRDATNSGYGMVGVQLKARIAANGRCLERKKPGPQPRVGAGKRAPEGELLP